MITFLGDVKIVFKTIAVVFKRKNLYTTVENKDKVEQAEKDSREFAEK